MKTKFYKRLVPIALIASMAVTNVGITSAGAQEIVEAGKSIVAPIVGVAPSAPAEGTENGSYTKLIAEQTVEAEYELTDSKPTLADVDDASVSVNVIGNAGSSYYKLSTIGVTKATHLAVVDSNGDVIDGVSIASLTDFSSDDQLHTMTATDYSKVNISVAGAAFGSESSLTCKLLVATNTLSPQWSEIAGTFTISKNVTDSRTGTGGDPGQGDPEPVAAGDVFQVPGGLVANAKGVTGYKIGVAKVVPYDTPVAQVKENEVLADKIVQSDVSGDNTLGTWDQTYNGTTDLKPTPGENGANLVNQYVLYYEDKAKDGAKTYVRCLSTKEAAALPYTWKTVDNLTGKAASGSTAATEEHAALATAISNAVLTDLFGANKSFTSTADKGYFMTDTDIAAQSKLDYSANYKYDDDGDANTEDVAEPGQVEVPAVAGVAKTATIVGVYDAAADDAKKDTVLGKLIAAYNTAHSSAKFEDNSDLYTKASEDGKTPASIKDAGYAALAAVLAADPAKYLAEDAHYTEVVARATAEYLNGLNHTIYSTGVHDLSSIVWVMETTKASDDKTTVNGKDVYPATSSSAKFWGKSFSQKTVKKQLTDVIGTKDASVTKTMGASVVVSNTKAAGKFNAAVYIKGVTKDYTPAKKNKDMNGDVIFAEGFYVPPAKTTAFKDVTKLPTGLSSNGKNGTVPVYKLTLAVGKSVKLPFAAKDGVEKDLVYKVCGVSSGFTVKDGKVTATDANGLATFTAAAEVSDATANTIKVYSRSDESVCAYVQVQTTAAFKSIRSNVSSIAVWPGSTQTISLGTVPPSANSSLKYKITAPSGVEVKNGDGSALETGGYALSNEIQVYSEKGVVAKGSVIKVELYEGDKAVSVKKPLEIKVSSVTAPQDIKTVKTGVKSKETKVIDNAEYTVIDVPKGGAVNLGYAVNPIAADASIVATNIDSSDAIAISGDVVKGVAVGGATISVQPKSRLFSDKFKDGKGTVSSGNDKGVAKYYINVYEPGASIVLNDERYVIKGGFLMTADAAASDCDREFQAGKPIQMIAPSVGTSEPIIWTANNPAAVKFVEETVTDDNDTPADSSDDTSENRLTITPLQTGTFTITGQTKCTKQKIKFKILVGAANSTEDTSMASAEAAKGLSFVKADGTPVTEAVADNPATSDADESVAQTTIYVGEKVNAFMSVGDNNVGGPVKFELADASQKTIATVTKNGVITAKGAGTVSIKATMTAGGSTIEKTEDITITAKPVTLKSQPFETGVVAGDAKGAKVSVSLNNFNKKTMDLVWVKKTTDGDPVIIDTLKNKLSGNITFEEGDAGKSFDVKVYPVDKDTEVTAATAFEEGFTVGNINVYATAIKTANVNNGDADTKKALSAFGAKVKDGAHNGVGQNHTYYIPIFATDTKGDALTSTDEDDVVISNSVHALADVSFVPKSGVTLANLTENKDQENDVVKNWDKAYGFIIVETNNQKLSGTTVVKATLKDSNKSVSVKLNVLDTELAPGTVYDPQHVNLAGTANTNIKLSNVVAASKADAKSPFVYNLAAADGNTAYQAIQKVAKDNKLKASGKVTTWQYVLVNDTNLKNLKKVELGKNVVIPTGVTGLDGKGAASANIGFTATFADTETAYLALAQVTYPIDTPWADKTKDADGKDVAETPATFKTGNEDITVKIVSIASKTPMVTSGSSSGGGSSTPSYSKAGTLYKGAGTLDVYATDSANYTSATVKVVDLNGETITGLTATGSTSGKFIMEATNAFEDGQVFRIEVLDNGAYVPKTNYKTVTVHDTTAIALNTSGASSATAIASGSSSALPDNVYIQMVGNPSLDLSTVQGTKITAARNSGDQTKFDVTTTGGVDTTKVYILAAAATGGTKISGTSYFIFTNAD